MIWVIDRTIRKQLLLALILLTGITGNSYGQGNTNEWVKTYVSGKGKDQQAFNSLMHHNPTVDVVKAISVYVNDTNNTTFEYAVFLIKKVEKRVTDKPGRISLMRSLMDCALKQDPQLSKSALRTMTVFDKSCFTEDVKDDIRLIVAQRNNGRQEAILLLGYLGESGDISYLKGLGKYSNLSKQDKYYQQLALARLNDGEAVQALCDKIQNKKLNDEIVLNTVPDLIYTRNKKIYDLLIKEITNEAKNCQSANNDSNEMIFCAFRIMEQLAGKIVGFPVQVDKTGEIVGDYTEALTQARKWVLSTKLEYSINTNQY